MVKPTKRSKNPIAGGVKIGHVHMKASDLQKIKAFYVDILGFDIMMERNDALFLSAGGYHHQLGFNTWESKNVGPPPPGTTGLYHIAILYPTRADLGDALRRLVKANYPIDGVNDHGTHEALYLSDPDGNGLELYWDRPKKDWPTDKDDHLDFHHQPPDIKSLLAEK
jgi:catechol 2,3-dioxygenase